MQKRSKTDRTADVRTIFLPDDKHVNPDTGLIEKGHWCLAMQVMVFFRLLLLLQSDGIELQVCRTANKIHLFHGWCIIASYPCCKVCHVFLLILYFADPQSGM